MSNWVRSGLILTGVLMILWILVPVPPVQITHIVQTPKPVQTKATMDEKRENKALTVSYARALGYDKREIKCLITLWTRESRLDHLADNPRSTAFGIAQLLRERSRKSELQILHGIRYIEHRYGGSACSALTHSNRRGWY